MTKRRTAGIQRRRTSDRALTSRPGLGGLDRRTVLAIAGLLTALVIAVVAGIIALVGAAPPPGQAQPDGGAGHIADGAPGGPYNSVPATSGSHWGSPANWGVYPNPVAEAQVLHNLEHSGIVIWYKPDLLPEAELDALRSYVEGQLRGNRFKFILSPWAGRDFEHAIAVTAWRYLLYLDDADTGQIDAFVGTHYGRGPEPAGGPGRPGG